MRVMVLVKATPGSESGILPSEQLLREMGQFNQALFDAGILLAGEGLLPSSQAVRVRFSGTERTVIDGPFAETKELVAGYWLWQVKSMQEAIEWVKRCPNPMLEDSDIEIRPIYELDQLGEVFTPELVEQEKNLAAQLERYQLDPPRYERRGALLIAGLNASYTFETRSNIPLQWQQFNAQRGTIPAQVGGDSYGVCWNFVPDQGFDYLTGVEVTGTADLPADLQSARLAPQRYAVFTHNKHISAIGDTIESIWSRWLPNSGHQAAPAPSFERYTPDFDPQSGTGGIEIWVALAD